MELKLLKELALLIEAAAPKAKDAKPVEKKSDELVIDDDKLDTGKGDTALTPDKAAFFFRPKFDVYGNLEQTDDEPLRRETKRIYALFGREHERSSVFGVTSGSEREFKRTSKMLGISTDGEVTFERVKRAGFTLAGRVGTKRLMKRGDFIVTLDIGPDGNDQGQITFYTAKPADKEGK